MDTPAGSVSRVGVVSPPPEGSDCPVSSQMEERKMSKKETTQVEAPGQAKPEVTEPEQAPVTGQYRTDLSKGEVRTEVSSQYWNRPADQRFLNLRDLLDHTKKSADHSRSAIVDARMIEVLTDSRDPEPLKFRVPGLPDDQPDTFAPTNWSFNQVCSLIKAPAGYLGKLPAEIAGINVQHGLMAYEQEHMKVYTQENGRSEFRAITGANYGRVYDHQLVEAVMRLAGNGTGDRRWKIPGTIDWSTRMYDPNTPITTDSTTLFASDRDVFMFLVDDRHPIEIGKLDNGEPDLVFRGFYCWNSEVGSKTLGLACFYLRGVCCNRMMWGVEGFEEIRIPHHSRAPERFEQEVAPALDRFAETATAKLVNGVLTAKNAIVAKDDDGRTSYLRGQGFSKPEASAIIKRVVKEEHHEAKSVWDFVQGITAVARDIQHQDQRVGMELRAKRILDKVA